MSYRTVLLHVADDAHLEAHADYATRLARLFDSRLLGLTCHRPSPWPQDGAVAFLGGDPLTVELRAAEEAAVARETTFLRRCRLAEVRSFEAIREDAASATAICERALGADLVLLEQPEPATKVYAERRAVVDAVLADSPRPVLMLPYAGRCVPGAGAVLVAWDGSPGAARAAAGALPLIRHVGAAHLVQLCHPGGDEEACRPGLDRAAAWLSAHGVSVQARVSPSELPVGEALLSEAADVGAGLLVMGAWGHRRMVERLLGGATRTLVHSMTMPVLFAH